MIFDTCADVLLPDADSDPDRPVVVAALALVDGPVDLESVDAGASVIVSVVESAAVEEGASDGDDSGVGDVCDGPSIIIPISIRLRSRKLSDIPLEELSCLLIMKPPILLKELGHGHAAAMVMNRRKKERSRTRPAPCILGVAQRMGNVRQDQQFQASTVRTLRS